VIPLIQQRISDPVVNNRDISLPLRVIRISLLQGFGNLQSFVVGSQCLGVILLPHQRIADRVVNEREIALSLRVIRIPFLQSL
jgi:hypothetical protein